MTFFTTEQQRYLGFLNLYMGGNLRKLSLERGPSETPSAIAKCREITVILNSAEKLFDIKQGVLISKRNPFDVSKVPESPYYDGPDFVIGNTPQQGINWVRSGEKARAVVIKTRPGSHEHDGWLDETMTAYNYAFKARKDAISYDEIENKVLLEQPQAGYPILLFTDRRKNWSFEGLFAVASTDKKFVTHERWANIGDVQDADDWSLPEGLGTYVTHIRTERSTPAVSLLKSKTHPDAKYAMTISTRSTELLISKPTTSSR